MAIRRRMRSVRPRRRVVRRSGGRRLKGIASALRGSARARAYAPPRTRIAGRKRTRGPKGWTETIFGKRRRTVKDSAGYIQWDQSKYTKSLGKLTLSKIVRANTQICDYIWKRVGRLDGAGQMYAGNWVDTTSTPDQAFRPIYLVDLTMKQGGSFGPVSQLSRKLGVTPEVVFNPVNGQAPSGTLTVDYQSAYNPTSANSSPSDVAILKWSEIRADIWGAQNHPVEWTFTLCQLNEKVLPADENAVLFDREGIDWWDSLSSKLCFSPSDRKINNGPYKNHIKVMDRRSFILNPTSTTENDADGHVRSVRFFYKLNRKCNFSWSNNAPAALVADVDPAQNSNFDPFTSGDSHFTVEPKARVFMMITCKNWRAPPTTYAGMTPANTATFNLSVYNRWIC